MAALTRRRSKDAHAGKLADFLWRRAVNLAWFTGGNS